MNEKQAGIMKTFAAVLFMFQFFCSNIVSPMTSFVSRIDINFPKALQIIGDEAFESTAIKTVVFSDKLLYIGERAFQDDNVLSDIFIPESVSYIGDSAIPRNTALVINGVEGSYAQKWAKINGIAFFANDIWPIARLNKDTHLTMVLLLLWIDCFTDKSDYLRFLERVKRFFRSMRPQDRPELYPLNYRFP